MNQKKLARFSGLYAAYVSAAMISRLLDDGFEATGLLPTDEWQDPALFGAVTVTLISLIWTLFSSAGLLTLFARQGLKTTSHLSFFRTVELIVVETIRSMAAAMLRLPLLLVPGLFEWVRLTPVPFIVIFNRAYQAGHIDALKASRQFFSEHRSLVILLLIPVSAIFISEILLTISPSDSLPFWRAPLQHMGSILLFSALRMGCDAFVLFKYKSKLSNKP